MKTRILLILTLFLTLTLMPIYAHESPATDSVSGGHDGTTSLHAKIDQFLKSVSDNHSFVVSLDSKTATDLLLDVRAAEDFQKSPVKDALNVPLTDLHDHIKDLPKDKRILVIGDPVDGAYAVFVLRLHSIDGWLAKSSEATGGCPLMEAHKKHH
ncbi:rhodanese-like domain-containing protein [Propionispora vibrioides]|uniref:Rhodanese-related sulfurtransferase n=1 Tax=Propionispora vibrioides TaxID=112903 RepID=A0A1H8T4Z2_9FIRM|nr:rhodanese-like domain-containing protein [Propionispora vibrioides]SEO85588.1 Rhodanese-related sulfurtransferase [Propionispora vibrioides]